MELDDLMPRNTPPKPKDLSNMSVSDLKDYIASMEAEIVRAREMIASKEASRAGAEAFFKR